MTSILKMTPSQAMNNAPGKDAVAHDPKNGQFASGGGGASGGGSSTATVGVEKVKHALHQQNLNAQNFGKRTPPGFKSAAVFGSTGKAAAGPGLAHPGKKLPGATSKALGGFELKAKDAVPEYEGRNLDNNSSYPTDAGSGVGSWPGRTI
jgi:hypothetical protein